MMLWCAELAVVPVTIHIPLKEVPLRLSAELIVETATITAPAAKIVRPEWARPPTAASRGLCERSQCSFAEASRNTV